MNPPSLQSNLRVVLVQCALDWHDPAANRARIGALLAPLAGTADLILLPEMFSTGFTMQPELAHETMAGDTMRWLRAQAATSGAVICGSLAMRCEDRFVNRLVWMRPDGSSVHYDKRHLFRMAGEHQHYSSDASGTVGAAPLIVELGGWRVRPLVCYDLRFPVFSRNRFNADGRAAYDLLLYVANWPSARQRAWESLLAARAIENLACVIGVNRVGSDGNGYAFAGGSCVLGPGGELLLQAGAEAGVHTQLLDRTQLQSYRTGFPAWRDADGFELLES